MVYPIVIGFVTLLLQRRHSAKASLQIYLHDSAATLTGLSALFLVMTMGVQSLFIAVTEIQTLVEWLILDSLWFLANILGVVWFLTRTFGYLRPERRADIVRAYAINHVWPAVLRRNLEDYRFHTAIESGWLPGPSYGDEGNNSNTAILINLIGRDRGDIQVTKQKRDKWFIRDVRLRPLSWVVLSWQRRETKLALAQEVQPVAFADQHHSRLFILPSAPGTQFKAMYGLCRIEGGTDLRWWEQWLVSRSFVLAPKKGNTTSLGISDILNGLIAEAQVAMEASEVVAFRGALHELVDLHADLIQAGDFVIDAGRHDNYANLVDCDYAFGRKMHVLWAREYHRLLEMAVERLSVSDTYFDYLVLVPGRLVSQLEAVRPIAILGNFLHLSQFLHYHLNRWWSRTGEEQGLLSHGPCEPVTLKAPSFALYDTAIKKFVGAWESLKNNSFPPTHDEAMDWEQYGEISELYTGHLDGTIYMLFGSLSLGNKEGAEWLCDSLIKWWNTTRFRFYNNRYYIRDERKLTLELSQKPWEEAKKVIDLSMPGVDECNAPKAMLAACIHNYWIDLCCVSLYAMIQLGKACECEKSLPAQLAGNLGKGKPLRTGGNEIVEEQWPIQTLEDLLIAILRQYYFDSGYRYQGRLDNVVERISDQRKPAMVPGRVYSGWALETLDTLGDGQLVLLCLLIKEDWTPSAQFMETIQKWGGENDAGLRKFTEQLEQWKTRLNNAIIREYEHFFSCIQAQFGAVENLEDAIAALKIGLDQLIRGVKNFRYEQLLDAQVSEERLRMIARWSSRSGFSKDGGDVPVSLFREVKYSVEEYTEFSMKICDINKGELVEPPMAPRASNEKEWFDRTVRSHVAASIMAETLSSLNPYSVNVDCPVAYWEQIQNAESIIRKEGGTPILLIAGRAEPHWILNWAKSYYDEYIERPEGLRLVRDKQFKSGSYVGSLNDIPVFVAPIGAGSSYLISQEALDILRVTEFEDGVFVGASVEPVQGKDMLINLKLVWRTRLDLSPSECWQLRYIQSDES